MEQVRSRQPVRFLRALQGDAQRVAAAQRLRKLHAGAADPVDLPEWSDLWWGWGGGGGGGGGGWWGVVGVVGLRESSKRGIINATMGEESCK